ncbi:MAG: hypothetical protein PHU49_04780 [Syntrophorhabdaceae bacterium]|nr:hypothetical protein [Syntrophorhabdaceae bacterium]
MTGNTMAKQERRDHVKENGMGETRANYNWINENTFNFHVMFAACLPHPGSDKNFIPFNPGLFRCWSGNNTL